MVSGDSLCVFIYMSYESVETLILVTRYMKLFKMYLKRFLFILLRWFHVLTYFTNHPPGFFC